MPWWSDELNPKPFVRGSNPFNGTKKRHFLECTVARWSALTGQNISYFIPFWPFFPLNRRFIIWCWYIGDILMIFLPIFSDFSPQNIVSTSPDTRYIVDISWHFPPWWRVSRCLKKSYARIKRNKIANNKNKTVS